MRGCALAAPVPERCRAVGRGGCCMSRWPMRLIVARHRRKGTEHVPQSEGAPRPPDRPFAHADDCKIVAPDPGVEPQWNEIERGLWERAAVCAASSIGASQPLAVSGSIRRIRRPHTPHGSVRVQGVTDPDVSRFSCGSRRRMATGGWSMPAARAVGRFRTTPRASGDGRRSLKS
jgi:hypothetical protein